MRFLRYAFLLIVMLAGALAFAQHNEDWLPVTKTDLDYKQVPGMPGAAAVRLYYAHIIDDNAGSEFVYERIKILNQKALTPKGAGGLGLADVEIPVQTITGSFGGSSFLDFGFRIGVSNLKARTIRPDGSIVDFTGRAFEKTMFKYRGNNLAVVAFTLPEVTVGSIIEYKYNYMAGGLFGFSRCAILSTDRWTMQDELFTVKENLYFRPYEGGIYQSHTNTSCEWEGAKIGRVSLNLTDKEKPKSRGNEVELQLENVPAFEPEELMPPEENYQKTVVFFYNRKGLNSVEDEWKDVATTQADRAETFIGRAHGVHEIALQLTGADSDPQVKLRKLYERAQQVRNLSYERFRSEEERKKEGLLPNDGAGDVLQHGYGSEREVAETFVALARAAGFEASMVQVGDRSKRFFSHEWTSLTQLDTLIVLVKLPTGDLYLEPGTPFCPYGMLRWNHTFTEGLKLKKNVVEFVKAIPSDYSKNVTTRTVNASLDKGGNLRGEVTLELKGYEALELRLLAIDEDEAGRKKAMEDEMRSRLPAGAVVKLTEAKGWKGSDEPLVLKFQIEVPSYASVAGKLFLVPAMLFKNQQNAALTHAQRKYPVYFPYPFKDADWISIAVPPGATVESVPEKQDAALQRMARYQAVSNFDGSQLVTQRQLAFNAITIPVEQYSDLKSFFGKVQTGDEQQVVFRGVQVNAEK